MPLLKAIQQLFPKLAIYPRPPPLPRYPRGTALHTREIPDPPLRFLRSYLPAWSTENRMPRGAILGNNSNFSKRVTSSFNEETNFFNENRLFRRLPLPLVRPLSTFIENQGGRGILLRGRGTKEKGISFDDSN